MPETEESTSYNTPAIKVKKKLMARLREDSCTLAIRARLEVRIALPQLEPETFSIPPHYANSDMIVVDLTRVTLKDLRSLLLDAWRLVAPKSVMKAQGHRVPGE